MTKVIAIDFDGTLCTNRFPEVGGPIWSVIRAARQAQKEGAKLILWTCRTGKELEEAVAAAKEWGLTFDAVNENLPERIEMFGNDPRKIGADEYWDDRALVALFASWYYDPNANDWGLGGWRCSRCGHKNDGLPATKEVPFGSVYFFAASHFCPRCGRPMVKEVMTNENP